MKYISLNWKLFALLALFFLVPLSGWYLAKYFESQLEEFRVAENKQQLSSYHSFLQKLLAEDSDFAQSLAIEKLPNLVTVGKRQSSILIDGFADEWFSYQDSALLSRNSDKPSRLLLVEDERFLFGLLQVNDNHLVYRSSPYSSQSSDMVRIDLGQGFWLFQAIAPGRLKVLREYGNGFKTLNSVFAVWQETQAGYNIEFRVPKSLVGDRLNAVLYDVDNKNLKEYNEIYQGVFTFTNFSYFPLSGVTNNDWLLSNNFSNQRLSILNKNGQIIYRVGDLFPITDSWFIKPDLVSQADSYLQSTKLDNQFTKKTKAGDINNEQVADGTHYFVVRSAKRFMLNGDEQGMVILESSLLDTKLKLISIQWVGFLIFAIIWLLLCIVILKRVSHYRERVSILRELTEEVYENDSETVDLKTISVEGDDEVAQVFENLNYFNKRLEQRRDHQQKLLARLNHELRTPLAIIGSSVDNLALSELTKEDEQLIANARSGLERLSLSFSRLSEANRLEESIDSVKLDWFELNPLLDSLVKSYARTWPHVTFELILTVKAVKIKGSEDLFAQLMDKLISNAVDFAKAGSPIKISLEQTKSTLILEVANQGPIIESSKLKSIFNIMESQRDKQYKQGASNLGLGLYMAKLIARRHRAKIVAKNLESKEGVALQLSWSKKSYIVL